MQHPIAIFSFQYLKSECKYFESAAVGSMSVSSYRAETRAKQPRGAAVSARTRVRSDPAVSQSAVSRQEGGCARRSQLLVVGLITTHCFVFLQCTNWAGVLVSGIDDQDYSNEAPLAI